MSQVGPIPPPPADPPVKPVINDAFWFEYSGELVKNAVSNRNMAAANLASILPWLWSIYSAGALAVVLELTTPLPRLALVLIVAPIPVLILAYWCAAWAQSPLTVKFDPRSPTEIEALYSRNLLAKSRRLHSAFALALAASLLVAAAIICVAMEKAGGHVK